MGIWNELPQEIVEAGSNTILNGHLDRCTDRKGLEGHGPNAGLDRGFWLERASWAKRPVVVLCDSGRGGEIPVLKRQTSHGLANLYRLNLLVCFGKKYNSRIKIIRLGKWSIFLKYFICTNCAHFSDFRWNVKYLWYFNWNCIIRELKSRHKIFTSYCKC